MTIQTINTPESNDAQQSFMPGEKEFYEHLMRRNRRGKIGQAFYRLAIAVAIMALGALFLNIVNEAFGTIAVQNEIDPASLTSDGRDFESLNNDQLGAILLEHAARKLRVFIRDSLSVIDPAEYTKTPLRYVLAGRNYPAEFADLTINDLKPEEHTALLVANLSNSALSDLVLTEVVKQEVVGSWPLLDTLFDYGAIVAERDADFPEAELQFTSWLDKDFFTNPMSSVPANAGIRTAFLGSLFIVVIVIVVALPLGVGAAIYLEEYADDTWFNRIIETNIRNLAGVPSIIYGMLGLAVFVRILGDLTSGAAFGAETSNGRTILSGALTLALLVLPIIIINTQEALRSVPSSIREASYGLGATKWQTIWRQVLPARIGGILTGTILAVSRAIGETAPLIVVGASTYIVADPNSPFSKFTALPIQIYQWTSRPQDQFRDIAAAAIIVLVLLLLTLNGTAIVLRNRYNKRF
jgi:phosphate transport system permease protein